VIENGGVCGEFKIVVKDSITKEILHEEKIKNMIMNAALDELVQAYLGFIPDLWIRYLAVGTSNTVVVATQTQLGAESFRCAPSVLPAETLNTGEVQTTFNILDTEAKVNIQEIGIFCGNTATASANTGLMLSRVLWSYDKSVSNVEIQIIRTDKVVKV
jgi:hypothetical protein